MRTFSCSSKNAFDNVNQFLAVRQGPVDLVVVTRPQIDHDVLVAKEKHHRAWIVQFIHGSEVGHFSNVNLKEVKPEQAKAGWDEQIRQLLIFVNYICIPSSTWQSFSCRLRLNTRLHP